MKTLIRKAAAKIGSFSTKAHVAFEAAVSQNAASIMLVFGITLVAVGSSNLALAQVDTTRITDVAEIILGSLIEGSFGALIMIVAGLVAIIAAAMGAYRAAMAALVVAVGAFILRSFVNIFFPTAGLAA